MKWLGFITRACTHMRANLSLQRPTSKESPFSNLPVEFYRCPESWLSQGRLQGRDSQWLLLGSSSCHTCSWGWIWALLQVSPLLQKMSHRYHSHRRGSPKWHWVGSGGFHWSPSQQRPKPRYAGSSLSVRYNENHLMHPRESFCSKYSPHHWAGLH